MICCRRRCGVARLCENSDLKSREVRGRISSSMRFFIFGSVPPIEREFSVQVSGEPGQVAALLNYRACERRFGRNEYERRLFHEHYVINTMCMAPQSFVSHLPPAAGNAELTRLGEGNCSTYAAWPLVDGSARSLPHMKGG